ncbi:MAG: glutamate-1-semialdehyde 2,1-aminomutase [Chloroflexota bacterium]|nr:glutamate-1-semialdehyde 2,1-aminomutase [Chloroflexota bacterium]
MADAAFTGRGEHESRQLFDRAQRVLPGGVSSPVRAFGAVGGTPRFMARGSGPTIWDVDGNQYLDYVMSWGPLIHGHAFAPVVESIEAAAAYGTSFGAPTAVEVELAEMLVSAIPSLEMVRFVSSGTEATMSAIRLARAYTGRDSIVKFAGNYHGHADSLLARAGSGALTFGIPTSPGVPAGAAASTIVTAYNDTEELEQLFAGCGREIAAVIVEPVAGNMGVIPPAPDFLESIRRLTDEAGVLFICDEVITGFRLAYGGAQSAYDITPDLTTLGKIVGAGLPIGVYGGRAEIMRSVAPLGPVYQAGTLSGNPLTMTAGIANLRPLADPAFYSRLGELSQQLAAGLRQAAQAAGIPVTVNAVTGMLTVFFRSGPVASLVDAEGSDTSRFAKFFHAMLDRGVNIPPSQFEAWMLSSSHSPEVIDRTIEIAGQAFLVQ